MARPGTGHRAPSNRLFDGHLSKAFISVQYLIRSTVVASPTCAGGRASERATRSIAGEGYTESALRRPCVFLATVQTTSARTRHSIADIAAAATRPLAAYRNETDRVRRFGGGGGANEAPGGYGGGARLNGITCSAICVQCCKQTREVRSKRLTISCGGSVELKHETLRGRCKQLRCRVDRVNGGGKVCAPTYLTSTYSFDRQKATFRSCQSAHTAAAARKSKINKSSR